MSSTAIPSQISSVANRRWPPYSDPAWPTISNGQLGGYLRGASRSIGSCVKTWPGQHWSIGDQEEGELDRQSTRLNPVNNAQLVCRRLLDTTKDEASRKKWSPNNSVT